MNNQSTRFETFSFLPPLSPAQAQAQASDILRQNCVPVIEYTENPSMAETYWNQWPIVSPRTKTNRASMEEVNASVVMMQVDSCSRRHPYAFIRLSGYDPVKRLNITSFIVKTPLEGV